MAPRLLHKIAVITGSSSGLGRAISLHFARHGAKVICSDLSSAARSLIPHETEIPTHELIRKEGGEALFLKANVREAKDMKELVNAAVGAWGQLDV